MFGATEVPSEVDTVPPIIAANELATAAQAAVEDVGGHVCGDAVQVNGDMSEVVPSEARAGGGGTRDGTASLARTCGSVSLCGFAFSPLKMRMDVLGLVRVAGGVTMGHWGAV
jgi:hypothetical protein